MLPALDAAPLPGFPGWRHRLCCSGRSFIRPPQHTPSNCMSQAPFWAPGAKHQRGRRDSRPHPTVGGTSRVCVARAPSCGMSHTEGRVTPSGGAVLFSGITGLNRCQEQTPAHPTGDTPTYPHIGPNVPDTHISQAFSLHCPALEGLPPVPRVGDPTGLCPAARP